MDALLVLIPIVLLLGLMVAGTPIAFSLALSGTVGILLQLGFNPAYDSLAQVPYSATSVYTLTVIPMFILMGLALSHSGMLDGIFNVTTRLTRRLPGGLGMATLAASTFLGGLSGSSVANAAALGRMSIDEMAKHGYSKPYAAAIVAAANTIAVMIPPSIVLVLYGILSGESIGRLLIAGIVPGLLTSVAYGTVIFAKALRRGARERVPSAAAVPADIAPAAGDPVDGVPRPTTARDWVGILCGGLLFLVVIGGLYLGIFTATEAGAIGALAACLIGAGFVLTRRDEGPHLRALGRASAASLKESSSITSMVFFLLVGGTLFTQFLVIAGVPTEVSRFILALDLPPLVVVIALLLVTIPLGMFIDGLSMLLILTPLTYPIVTSLGFDGIWYGVLLVKMSEVGLLTPPIGLNVFVVSGSVKGIRSEQVFGQIWPFVLADLILVAVLVAFPEIVTFLPDLSASR